MEAGRAALTMETPTDKPLELSQRMAQLRAREALELIELAQGKLAEAGARLSRVIGAASECRLIGDRYDETKALWHRLNLSLNGKWQRLRMDNL